MDCLKNYLFLTKFLKIVLYDSFKAKIGSACINNQICTNQVDM